MVGLPSAHPTEPWSGTGTGTAQCLRLCRVHLLDLPIQHRRHRWKINFRLPGTIILRYVKRERVVDADTRPPLRLPTRARLPTESDDPTARLRATERRGSWCCGAFVDLFGRRARVKRQATWIRIPSIPSHSVAPRRAVLLQHLQHHTTATSTTINHRSPSRNGAEASVTTQHRHSAAAPSVPAGSSTVNSHLACRKHLVTYSVGHVLQSGSVSQIRGSLSESPGDGLAPCLGRLAPASHVGLHW